MHARSLRRLGCASLAALALASGCARPPSVLRGDFALLTPAEAARGVTAAEPVRWGGVVAEVRPSQERTCFVVVAMPLDDSARPVRVDESSGRFVACAQGFFDPEVYAAGRLVTVIGWLSGTSREKVGGYEYEAPVVDAYIVFLWPERPPYPYYAWGPGPYWGWGPGFWGFGGPAFGPWGPWPYYYRPWIW